jgi:selenide,water dikinase
VRGSNVAATIELAALPLLPDAKEHLRAKLCPAGSKANRAHVAPDTSWADGTPLAAEGDDSERELLASLACDAQTSGGLLLCLASERANACVDELRDVGLPAAVIGSLTDGSTIVVQ